MKTSIILIEDNERLSENISEILTIQNYLVLGILDNAEDALKEIEEKKPDLALIDIKLKGSKTGIDLASEIRRTMNLPIVFLTSASGKEVIEKVAHLNPDGFITKPFNIKSIVTTIEFAVNNSKAKMKLNESNLVPSDNSDIYIRENGWLIRIEVKDIDWLKADGSYTHLWVNEKAYTLRNTAKEILVHLPESLFFRVNKSDIVNLSKIDAINSKVIKLKNREIPLGRNYYKEIMQIINKISG